MIKDKYVLNRVKIYMYDSLKKNKTIDPYILSELIEQWEFDYEIRKEYCSEQEHERIKKKIKALNEYLASEGSAQDVTRLIDRIREINW